MGLEYFLAIQQICPMWRTVQLMAVKVGRDRNLLLSATE